MGIINPPHGDRFIYIKLLNSGLPQNKHPVKAGYHQDTLSGSHNAFSRVRVLRGGYDGPHL
jgi:hypothetical protein